MSGRPATHDRHDILSQCPPGSGPSVEPSAGNASRAAPVRLSLVYGYFSSDESIHTQEEEEKKKKKGDKNLDTTIKTGIWKT